MKDSDKLIVTESIFPYPFFTCVLVGLPIVVALMVLFAPQLDIAFEYVRYYMGKLDDWSLSVRNQVVVFMALTVLLFFSGAWIFVNKIR